MEELDELKLVHFFCIIWPLKISDDNPMIGKNKDFAFFLIPGHNLKDQQCSDICKSLSQLRLALENSDHQMGQSHGAQNIHLVHFEA